MLHLETAIPHIGIAVEQPRQQWAALMLQQAQLMQMQTRMLTLTAQLVHQHLLIMLQQQQIIQAQDQQQGQLQQHVNQPQLYVVVVLQRAQAVQQRQKALRSQLQGNLNQEEKCLSNLVHPRPTTHGILISRKQQLLQKNYIRMVFTTLAC